jgi:hypothetical protein
MQFHPRAVMVVLSGSGLAALSAMLMQLALLLQSPLADYGFFAFVQVVQGLLIGVSSALFSAPLLSRWQSAAQHTPIATGSYFMLQLLFVAVSFGLVFVLTLYYQFSWLTAAWLALAAALQLWRWFARSLLQNTVNTRALVQSDAIFSLLALAGTALLWLTQQISLLHLAQLNALAAAGSLLLSGEHFWQQHRQMWQQRDWRQWQQGWQQQAKPALVGVLSAESAANAHSYLITLLAGPAAFAPIAAASMLYRPAALLLTNLSQLCRGQLQQAWRQQQPLSALLRHYRMQCLWLWGANSAILLLLLWICAEPLDHWLQAKQFVPADFLLAVLLWGILTLQRAWRSSAAIQLQVYNQFAALAHTALWPALLSVALVLVFLQFLPAVWSLLAVILSELWMAWLLRRAVQRITVGSE